MEFQTNQNPDGARMQHTRREKAEKGAESTDNLDTVVFNECKEKMRPVKKALKALDKVDDMPESERIQHTLQCLTHIGEHIEKCLSAIRDPGKLCEWRKNLWCFVSKFTDFEGMELFKMYRNIPKKQRREDGDSKPKAEEGKNAHLKRKRKDTDNKQTEKKRISHFTEQRRQQHDAPTFRGNVDAKSRKAEELLHAFTIPKKCLSESARYLPDAKRERDRAEYGRRRPIIRNSSDPDYDKDRDESRRHSRGRRDSYDRVHASNDVPRKRNY